MSPRFRYRCSRFYHPNSMKPYNQVRCPRCGEIGTLWVARRSKLSGEITAFVIAHNLPNGRLRKCHFGRYSEYFEILYKRYILALNQLELANIIYRASKAINKIENPDKI